MTGECFEGCESTKFIRSVAGSLHGVPASQRASDLSLGRNFSETNSRHPAQPLGVGGESRMHVEAVASAGTGRAALHRWIAVGDEYHARQVVADHRLQGGAQFGEAGRKVAIQDALRFRGG